MKVFVRLLLAVFLPIAVGCLFLIPTITSDNGYVAGFAFFPSFILTILLSAVLLLVAIITTGIRGRPGLWLWPAGPLLAIGFFGFAMIAKQFELGAYREDPMVSIPPPVANRVDFKADASPDDIERFWIDVIGIPDENGAHRFVPGIQSAARTGDRSITFAFRPEATEEQKEDVRMRIKAYAPVRRYLENTSTQLDKEPINPPSNAKEPTNFRFSQ